MAASSGVRVHGGELEHCALCTSVRIDLSDQGHKFTQSAVQPAISAIYIDKHKKRLSFRSIETGECTCTNDPQYVFNSIVYYMCIIGLLYMGIVQCPGFYLGIF